MALAHKKSILPVTEERRRFQRVRVHLLGRYMLPDRREFPCQIINMSPGGLALLAPGIGNVGDRVIAYLDHIGRVEGKITRIIDNGFAMTVGATARKRDKLAAQLTWLANRDILNLPEDRRHDRIIPRNPMAEIAGAARQGAVAGGAKPGRRLRARVRPRADGRDARRQRYRAVKRGAIQNSTGFLRGPFGPLTFSFFAITGSRQGGQSSELDCAVKLTFYR
jgi:PilZ domain